MIEQKNLFGAPSAAGASKKPAAVAKPAYKAPPNLTLVGGLGKSTLKDDSVYLLRVLARQHMRHFPQKKAKERFLETIQSEVSFKRGKLPPELVLMNLLMKNTVQP